MKRQPYTYMQNDSTSSFEHSWGELWIYVSTGKCNLRVHESESLKSLHAPAGAHRVLDQPVVLAVVSAIADDGDSVIEH